MICAFLACHSLNSNTPILLNEWPHCIINHFCCQWSYQTKLKVQIFVHVLKIVINTLLELIYLTSMLLTSRTDIFKWHKITKCCAEHIGSQLPSEQMRTPDVSLRIKKFFFANNKYLFSNVREKMKTFMKTYLSLLNCKAPISSLF